MIAQKITDIRVIIRQRRAVNEKRMINNALAMIEAAREIAESTRLAVKSGWITPLYEYHLSDRAGMSYSTARGAITAESKGAMVARS